MNVDLSEHRKSTLSENFVLYHKVIGDEIEMVAEVKTNTWAGLGWKPTGPNSCRNLDHGKCFLRLLRLLWWCRVRTVLAVTLLLQLISGSCPLASGHLQSPARAATQMH